MKKNTIIWIFAILLIGASIYTVKTNQAPGNLQAKSGTPEITTDSTEKTDTKIALPDFTLTDLEGNSVSLKDFRGKNVYLNFWASWCPPCKAEMPDIEKLYQETKGTDLVILAVNIGEDKKTVAKFIGENKYNFKVLLDANSSVAQAYGISSIPVSIFIDKEGNMVNSQVGALSYEQMKGYVNLFQ